MVPLSMGPATGKCQDWAGRWLRERSETRGRRLIGWTPCVTSTTGLAGAVNDLARHTGALHGPALAYASYGVAALRAAAGGRGWSSRRHRESRVLAAAGWAPLATLLAVAINQPVGRAVHEARPYVTHPQWLRLAAPTSDFSFPSDHATMAGAVVVGLLAGLSPARAHRGGARRR